MPISKVTTGSITDSVAIDTDTLVVDGTNNRVGIGTATPNEALTIEAPLSGNTGLAINYSGDNKAGITVNPITGQIQVGAHPDLTSAGGYYLSFNTAASNTVYERMKIDSSGRVTMPYQPSFAATRNQGDVTNAVYVYPNVYHNIGGHYNNSNGRFTAPVTGSYFISANHMTANNGTYNNYTYEIRVNGSLFQYVYSSSGGNLHHRWNWHGVMYLQAGDYVEVFIPAGFYIYGQSSLYQHFSGYLIG